jgi:hypothetical protein
MMFKLIFFWTTFWNLLNFGYRLEAVSVLI